MTIYILKSPEEDTRGLPDHESTIWSQIICLIFSDEIKNFAKMTCSSEWISDCCLTPAQQIFSYIMARTS